MVGVVLADVLELFTLPANWGDVAHHYRAAVADLPPDLLIVAMRHIRDHSRFFPKPAELRIPVTRELTERKMALTRLELAGRIARRRAETGAGSPQGDFPVSDGPVDVGAAVRRLKAVDLERRSATAPILERGERVADPESLRRAAQSLEGFRLVDLTEDEVEARMRGFMGNKL